MFSVKSLLWLICLFVAVFPASSLFVNNGTIGKIRRVRQTDCGTFSYKCKSGECIDEDLRCDGKSDCKDGSDEDESCKSIPCPAYLFRCQYGACINKDLECDGKQDCKDKSDENSPNCKNSSIPSTCAVDQFQCNSGQCISEDNKCDGTAQCQDNSDESVDTCSKMKCPGFTFRCDYGACVDGDARCNQVKECFDGSDESPQLCGTPIQNTTEAEVPKRSDQCVLPPHPKYGYWAIAGGNFPNFRPGDIVESGTFLEIKCSDPEKYIFVGQTFVSCSLGVWNPNIGQCSPLCPQIYSTATMTVWCNGIENCTRPLSATKASFQCANYYEDLSLTRRPTRICRDGSWDYSIPKCEAACGRKRVNAQTLIINGQNATEGDYPWQAAIYNQNKILICGGSLITQKLVLTAAHCVTDQKTNVLSPAENYEVAVGKYYRQHGDSKDRQAQYSKVANITISPRYKGIWQGYIGDIAILVTVRQFALSDRVLPICLDYGFNIRFNSLETAVVTGWGNTVESGKPSEELKELSVPNIDSNTCQTSLPSEFAQKYFTFDKLCAGFHNEGKAVCKGDSGSPLAFKYKDDGRYYVQGIVSLSPESTNSSVGGCSSQSYGLYTKVSEYIDFIENAKAVYDY